MVARDCILAGKVICVARLYDCLRLYAGWEGSLCIQAIWLRETVCWLGRFFVYPGYMVAWDCMLAGKVLCVSRLYGGPRLYAGWDGSCVARLYGGPRLMLAWKVICVARQYGSLRLFAGWEGSLCSQAIWWPETVFWQGWFLCSQALWWSETVCWQGKFFV